MLVALDGARATVLWWTFPSYMLLVGMGIAVSAMMMAVLLRRSWSLRQTADSVLLALALGVILARAEHVLMNWPYFAQAPAEIFNAAAGGLDTHGALIGAAVGGWLASRIHKQDYRTWLAAAFIAVPVIALAAWWGCAAAACAYGLEVANLADYPSALVWEAAGEFTLVAPRYAVQPIGVWVSLVCAVGLSLAGYAGLRGIRRTALAVCLLMVTSIALGVLRGDTADYRAFGLALWLDVATFLLALLAALRVRRISADPA